MLCFAAQWRTQYLLVSLAVGQQFRERFELEERYLHEPLAVCPGESDRQGRNTDRKCRFNKKHRVCARLLASKDLDSSRVLWGEFDYWELVKLKPWDDQIRANNGDSWCVDMWKIAQIMYEIGCQNVHIRCDATDVNFIVDAWADMIGRSEQEVAIEVIRCMTDKCPHRAREGLFRDIRDEIDTESSDRDMALPRRKLTPPKRFWPAPWDAPSGKLAGRGRSVGAPAWWHCHSTHAPLSIFTMSGKSLQTIVGVISAASIGFFVTSGIMFALLRFQSDASTVGDEAFLAA